MRKFPVALQIYSVRDMLEKDFEGTLRKVKAMGYDGVEPAGLYGHTAVEVKALLDEIGLQMVSAHIGVDELQQDAALDDYKAAGLEYAVIPWMTGPKTDAELAENIAKIRAIAERCKARGLQLLYHNHDFEFHKMGDAYVLDHYYGNVPAELLQTELDTCWVNVGGEDPAAYVRKYSGRAPVVHLKDFVGQKTENMYGLIGGKDAGKTDTEKFAFRPVGYGKQNVPEIIAAAEDAGTKWLVVEMDQPAMDKNSLECAEMSIQYLNTVL